MDYDIYGFPKKGGGNFEISNNSVMTEWGRSEMVLPAGKIFSELKQHREDSLKNSADHTSAFVRKTSFLNLEKSTEKRRSKTEKAIGLQDIQKHFAGCLKDAARSLGVCPTTLKRICRQHGISRWPSRKIKKVGHSLKKLQVVIDSVHGAEGAFQFSSLYENFTKGAWSDKDLMGTTSYSTVLKQNDQPESSNTKQQQEIRFISHTSGSNSLSFSSCTQSSTSSLGCSSGLEQHANTSELTIKQETSVEENQAGMFKKSRSLELQGSAKDTPVPLARSQSHAENLSILQNRHDSLKIKAIYGEDKVIFRLQPNWGFKDLKQEIMRRFNIANSIPVDLKYLDEDSEWILLTCDADLQECVDVYKSLNAHTVKILVYHNAELNMRSFFGQTGLS
uniref:Protein NLP2-like n=1 Tax=Ananas comosus var. bracteatus TaxID=296719 RepID=A0A6V7QND9_ANACO|nr:unnamed protein product [Ananas comosus var. bracteatus]